jgi:hypothetical protein
MTTVRVDVDPQGQRLGREHRADQAVREQLLDHLLERGQRARVVGGDAALQAAQPLGVSEHRQVGGRDAGRGPLGQRGDLLGLLRRGQLEPGVRHCCTARSQPARLKMNVIAGAARPRPAGDHLGRPVPR